MDVQAMKALQLAKQNASNLKNLTDIPLLPNNLFTNISLTSGSYVRWDLGTLGTNSSYSVSDYIPILPNTLYQINFGDQVAFYDSNKTYVSGVNNNTQPNSTVSFVTPLNGYFLRLSIPNAKISSVQLFQLAKLLNGVKITENNIHPSSKLIVGQPNKNLFNKNAVIVGQYVRWNLGDFGSNSTYSVSDYIPVNPSTSYAVNFGDQVAFYDINKTYVSGVNNNTQPNNSATFTTPSNCYFLRLSIPNTKLSTAQLEQGTTSTNYVNYGLVIPSTYLTNGGLYTSIASIMSKVTQNNGIKIKLIGDSITAGLMGTGYATNGEVIWGSYQANTSGHCWANSLRDYLQSKFTCTVKNWGVSGRTSNDLLTNIGTLVASDDNIIICMIGTNDRNVGNNSPQTKLYSNLVAIGDYVRGLGKDIIFMSCIPASIANETDVSNPKNYHMEDVDSVIMSVAAHYNMEYISLYKAFMNYCDFKNITIDSLLSDGLHPSDSGYDVMFNLVCDRLGVGRKRSGATW